MRPTPQKPISSSRARRFALWARLWLLRLMWLGAQCGGIAVLWFESLLVRQLPLMRRSVVCILFLHAASQVTPRSKPTAFHVAQKRRAGALRAFIGARVRRRLRRAGLAALLAIISAPEQAAGPIIKALRRGFARRRLKPRPSLGVLTAECASPFLACAGADTS